MPPTWARARGPSRRARYALRWHLQTRSGETRGRATVAVMPPDSLRFEYRAPFGRHGAALIVGAEVVWAEPKDDVQRLIAVVPLLWAALGVPWRPRGVGEVETRPKGEPAGWRIAWADTVLTYVRRTGPPSGMTTQMLAGQRAVGTAYVAFSEASQFPKEGRVQFADARSRLAFVVDSVDLDSATTPSRR